MRGNDDRAETRDLRGELRGELRARTQTQALAPQHAPVARLPVAGSAPARSQSGQHGAWQSAGPPPPTSHRPSLAVVRAPNQFDSSFEGRGFGSGASSRSVVSTLSTHRPVSTDAGSKIMDKLSRLRTVAYNEHGDLCGEDPGRDGRAADTGAGGAGDVHGSGAERFARARGDSRWDE